MSLMSTINHSVYYTPITHLTTNVWEMPSLLCKTRDISQI